MDFTLKAYEEYLDLFIAKGYVFLRYDEYFDKKDSLKGKFCLIRHDVDRKPKNSLEMARLENRKGIVSTYYFRIKDNTLKPKIIKSISDLGHEIGYHYESLSDTNGDINKAIENFTFHLKHLRTIVPISTCAMHGRPLKPWDNRDMWRDESNHKYLKENLGLKGELYLDIDYSDIAYINDSGRNWTSGKANRRDKVSSNINADFQNQEELLVYLRTAPHSKVVFQIHPERWSDNKLEWLLQYMQDKLINVAKKMVSLLKNN